MSDKPVIIRAATSLAVEANGARAVYGKGQPIDFHLDESGTPFIVWTEDEQIIPVPPENTVAPSGSVSSAATKDQDVKISFSNMDDLTCAQDALGTAGISSRLLSGDMTSLIINKEVSSNAMTVLNNAGISGSLVKEAVNKNKLKNTILAFDDHDVMEAFLSNVVFEEELAPNFAFKNLTLNDLLIREGISADILTNYIAENSRNVVTESKSATSIRVPVRTINHTLSTKTRAARLEAIKADYNPGKSTVKIVDTVETDRSNHFDRVGYYVCENLMTSPASVKESVSRVRNYLRHSLQENVKVTILNEDDIQVDLLNNTPRSELIEAMNIVNDSMFVPFSMIETSQTSFKISPRKEKNILSEGFYGNDKPAFLCENVDTTTEETYNVGANVKIVGGDLVGKQGIVSAVEGVGDNLIYTIALSATNSVMVGAKDLEAM